MNQINSTFSQSEITPVSVGDWVVTFLITAIPVVNIIMLLVWAFGSSTHPSKKTWAQAYLIMIAIIFLLFLMFSSFFIGCLASLANN